MIYSANLFEQESVDRRGFLRHAACFVVASLAHASLVKGAEAQNSPSSNSKFDDILRQFQQDPQLADSLRQNNELITGGFQAAPIRTPKSKTVISSRADRLIVFSEVTSKNYYESKYTSPAWPGGKSGVTIGIGYDLGQAPPDLFKEDWKSYLSPDDIHSLRVACGQRGEKAGELARELASVKIDWKKAYSQYSGESLPRYIGATEGALPNTQVLGKDSLGALVSLVFNRSASQFDHEGDRYLEMRRIKEHMSSKQFWLIPSELRCMKRLWQNEAGQQGVVLRREAEAILFEIGLSS
jgi:hypothetical protein